MITLKLKPTATAQHPRRIGELVSVGAKGATRLKLDPGFTRVKNMKNGKIGVIQDLLSEQFTVYYEDRSGVEFFFKKYYKLDWEVVL